MIPAIPALQHKAVLTQLTQLTHARKYNKTENKFIPQTGNYQHFSSLMSLFVGVGEYELRAQNTRELRRQIKVV